ncbi:hypothetical protein [Arthrobacter sp. M4]|uniref:hypothetical protein n=1 Tax=Arthrobacter sp. M4 TaxID=218160 RepID=UPI001CDB8C9B|nr:hypothetical protein [Arthrobacter sp. M4]MCA4135424.1 hypothetical protein [Arthrobacter sp. M4]
MLERFLIIVAVAVVGASLAIAGRLRFAGAEGSGARSSGVRSSGTRQFIEQLQLTGNLAACVLEALLPFATAFRGVPVLSFSAAVLQFVAVAIHRTQLPPVRALRHKEDEGRKQDGQHHFRRLGWPYHTVFAAGTLLLVAYLSTIVGYFF